MAMVAAGACFTLLLEMASHRNMHKEDSGLIEFAPPQPSRTIGRVRPKGKYLPPAAKVFIKKLQHLTQNLGQEEGPQSFRQSLIGLFLAR